VDSAEDILRLAHEVRDLAVWRQGIDLGWEPEGRINEEKTGPGQFGVRGGTRAQYDQLRLSFGWIVDEFALALGPEPAGFDPLIQALEKTERALLGPDNANALPKLIDLTEGYTVASSVADSKHDSFMVQVDTINNHLAGWFGDAADGFRENYVFRIPTVIANQATVVRAMRGALTTNQKLYQQRRADLYEIATKIKAALDTSDNRLGAPDWGIVLTVVSGVLAVGAGVAAFPAGAAAAALATAGDAIALAMTLKDVDTQTKPDPLPIDHTNCATIVASLYDALSVLKQRVAAVEDLIVENLRNNYALLTGPFRDHFLSPRPAVIDLSTHPVPDLWNRFDH
jgi:hypothetical protein